MVFRLFALARDHGAFGQGSCTMPVLPYFVAGCCGPCSPLVHFACRDVRTESLFAS